MKDVDNFVTGYNGFYTLKKCIEEYNNTIQAIERFKKKKEKFDDLLNADNPSQQDLTFKEEYVLYTMIEKAILEENDFKIDLYALKQKFKELHSDLREYLNITNIIENLENRKKEIMDEDITFDYLDSGQDFNDHCIEKHCFVVEDQALKCVYCGATTKDYSLNQEEFEFLVLCAKQKGILLEDFKKEDWPLLQVRIEEQDYRRSSRPELDMDADDYYDQAEEQFYEDEAEFHELEITLQKAHMLDSKIYENEKIKLNNPKYLSDTKKKELLDKLEKELNEIKKTNSRFKALLIEECKTAKYEILILSGEHIPTLLQETTDEDEKIALTKAYYNLRDDDFRMNSGYFNSNHRNNDAVFYDCYTANPEINSRILEMKLKRK